MPPEVTERPLSGEAGSAALRFCGRAVELKKLIERWLLASDVDKPSAQVVVVKAERGVGKTRLVLEFYRWLSRQVDRKGYWPDALSIVDRNLAVNPEPENCRIRDQKIPYLWWGVRGTDPGRENGVAGDAIATYDRYLAPHLVALLIRENVRRTGKAVAKVWKEAFVGALESELEELLKAAIPYFGLVIRVGKAIHKTQQVVREGIEDGGLDKAVEKPFSRADRVLEDLERTFNPKTSSFAKTPGIIFIDDAQFASTDATLLSFGERLIHMAVTQEWPMMIVATHWWQQFAEDKDATTFAGLIRHARPAAVVGDPRAGLPAGYLEGQNYCEIDLRPVDDLSGALIDRLPGLTEGQRSAILERVGGNPRFLEQIISFLLERKKYFEGHDGNKALTAGGLDEALKKTPNIFEVVLERLNGAPAEVQEAVCLASVQGMQFSNSITDEFAQAAISRSVREPLAMAENPYRWVTGHGPSEARAVGEFAERLFYLVAAEHRESLPSLPDDAALQNALKNVLSARLDDPSLNEKLDVDDRALTYRLSANIFERSTEAADKTRALLAFAHLTQLEESRYSFEGALNAASRFATLFSTAPDSREMIPAWAVRRCVSPLKSAGHLDEATALLDSMLGLQRDRAQRLKTPEARQDFASTLNNAGVLASMREDHGAAAELFRQSLDILRDLAQQLKSAEAQEDLASTLNNAGALAEKRDDHAAAAELFRQSMEIRRELAQRLKTPEALSKLAESLYNAGVMALRREDHAAAAELDRQSLDIRRDLAQRLKTAEALSELAQSLNSAGVLAELREDHAAAAELFRQSLDIRRELAQRLKTPEALSELAESLYTAGMLAAKREDHAAAAELYRESLDIRRDLAQRLKTPEALSRLAQSLKKAGALAEEREDHAAAAELFRQSLDIRRDLGERLKTPEALNELAESLNNAGVLATKREDLAAAAELQRQSLDIRRDLAQRLKTPEALGELAYSLYTTGVLAAKREDHAAAAEFFKESLDIRRDLAQRLKTHDALNELAQSLHTAGVLAEDRGDHAAAAELFRERVDILRDLAQRLKTPEALGELGYSLYTAGLLAAKRKDHAGAAELLRQSLDIRRDLAQRLKTPEAQQDLASTLNEAGVLAEDRGDHAAAAELYRQNLDIRRDLAQRLKTAEALSVLADSLQDAGVLAEKLGDNAAAAGACEEILGIRRGLAERLNTPKALSDYSSSLFSMASVSVLKGDFTTAMTYWSEGQEIAAKLPANLKESLIPAFEQLYQGIERKQA
jgi:tetratricopeptide (TPR) repeat protein